MSKIEVNAIEPQCGTNLTVGASGDTITFPSGTTVVNNGSQTGFGRTGTVDWDTTVKTASFTATSGDGFFVDSTSGAITVTLPASPSANDIVAVADYAGTAATNNITIARNGSNFEGGTENGSISINRQTATLIFVDSTQGWIVVNSNDASFVAPGFVTATGGTITTCGNFKIHTFTGPGTFCVSCAGNPLGSETVDYLVIAGGGGGGGDRGGGGGAGGYRESSGTSSGCYTASPLGACVSALPVSVQGYSITVGGGGAGGTQPAPSSPAGVNGNSSIFSTITSAGGGGGKNSNTGTAGSGGSGGGTSGSAPGGRASGNTPPVSPPQGNPGGLGQDGSPFATGAGGGGAGAAGGDASAPSGVTPAGGAGVSTSITGAAVTRAGGGGATGKNPTVGSAGGSGGGGDGSTGGTNPGTTNTGGGGGSSCTGCAGAGGSGIVVIRYKFQ